MKSRTCELCNQEATLYCASDSAFLCLNCDARVHQANFLVSRHVRQFLCSKCKAYADNCLSVAKMTTFRPTCHCCWPKVISDEVVSISLSSHSSSDCVSTAESFSTAPDKTACSSSSPGITGEGDSRVDIKVAARCYSGEVTSYERRRRKEATWTRNVDAKAVQVFSSWCRKLGLVQNCDSIVSIARQAFVLCMRRCSALQLRVMLAASFWFGLRLCGRDRAVVSTLQDLTRLEEMARVPSKLIVAAQGKLTRLWAAGPAALKEGWAECSVS